jgi:uncharacterized SAM-binding protein YcdF (DUF218 family)
VWILPQISVLSDRSVKRQSWTKDEAEDQPICLDTDQGSKFFGIVRRKERWSLSWLGWLIVAFTTILGSLLLFVTIYPFLAETRRVPTNFLVVEGWIHEYAIRAAIQEFRSGAYERVFTTGGPVEGTGGYINDYNTAASVGADLLRKNGVETEFIQMVPSRVMNRDRTYGAALALRNWFLEHHTPVHSINVVTEDTHARRTQLLFQEALGSRITVGIIAVPHPDYDSRYWWRYSEGVKGVFSEGVAYLYVKFFFHPKEALPVQNGSGKSVANLKS